MNKLNFVKMHGAGNDFVLIDDRAETFPAHDHMLIAALASRRTGIGCEGVILVRQAKSGDADFQMVFFNPDGGEVDLCGNGARCVAAFAYAIGAAPKPCMTFRTRAGLVDAQVLSPQLVKVWLPEPKTRRYGLTVNGVQGDFVVTGVPHFVVQCPKVSGLDIETRGRELRLAEEFAPEGSNIDFVQFIPPSKAIMRTYERGVEAESGACGTGAIAAAVVGVEVKGMSLPIHVRTTQGYELTVDADWRNAHATGFTLTGPVRQVYAGTVDLDELEIM